MPASFEPYHITLIFVAVITSVVAPVLLQMVKYYLTERRVKKTKEGNIVEKLKQEGVIDARLEKIRLKYNTDRAWIAIFHNGGHMFTGRGLQKFSLVHEVVRRGVSTEGSNTQNLPTSLFNALFKEIAEKGVYQTLDTIITGNIVNTSLQGFFDARGVKSFLAVPIIDIRDNIIGILCLDTVHSIINLTERDIENIKHEAGIIAGYLG